MSAGWTHGAIRQIDSWTAHPALVELVALFGGVFAPHPDLDARLAFLEEFSAVWDYRSRARRAGPVSCQDGSGAARWEISPLRLPVAQLNRICALVRKLGLLTGYGPTGRGFDYLLLVGGGRYANVLRAQFARELVAEYGIGHVVMAAASRRLLPSESDAVAACAPHARTEFELVAAAAADAFGIDARDALEHGRLRADNPQRDEAAWHYTAAQTSAGVPVTLLEAPSPDPANRRATSADTFTHSARAMAMQGATCLMATGQPYAAFQHFDALRTLSLPFGISVQTTGFGIERYESLGESDRQHPARLLQEVRSTIRAARSLLGELQPPRQSVATMGQSLDGR